MSTSITVTIARSPYFTPPADTELKLTVLRYAIPIIAKGWAGEIQIDPSRPMRGGVGAVGKLTQGSSVFEVQAVDLTFAGGEFEAELHGKEHVEDGHAYTTISGRVSVAVAVVPVPAPQSERTAAQAVAPYFEGQRIANEMAIRSADSHVFPTRTKP